MKTKRMQNLITLILIVLCTAVFADSNFDRLIEKGKYQEALDYADEKIDVGNRTAETWVKLGKANLALKLAEKALACYMVAWRQDSKNYDALLGAAVIYNKLEQPDMAIDYAKKAMEQKFTGDASWEYARACIALKRTADAKKALEKVIETDPDNVVANRELGIIYFGEKKYSNAIPLLQKAYNEKEDANVAYQIGKCYLETNSMDYAIKYLEKAVKSDEKMYDAQMDLARAYFSKGEYKDAAQKYDLAIPKVKSTPMDHYNRAVAKDKRGDENGAISGYTSAVKKFGNAKKKEALLAREKVGRFDLKGKKYTAALVQFKFIEKADANAKTVKDIYFLLDDAYEGAKQDAKAIAALNKAIALDSKNLEAYTRLAGLYEKTKQTEKARQTYEKMISLDPNDPNIYMVLARYYHKKKDYKTALGHYVKCNSLKRSADAAEGIALCADKLKQYDTARDAAESAVQMDKYRWESRDVLYRILLKEKDYKGAAGHLEELVKKHPKELKYWESLAECYNQLKKTDDLVQADQKVIELDKKNVESRNRYADYKFEKKDLSTAYIVYKELSVLTPKNSKVFKNLHLIAVELKKKKEAIIYAQKYLALYPNDAIIQRDLGDMLYESKKLDGALAAYRAAIKIDPKIKGFYTRYAEIVIAKGQQREAIKALEGVIASGEADEGTYTTLGMIYKKLKSYKSALENYQKALKMNPNNTDVLVAYAECQSLTGDVNGAIISYEQAVMLDKNAEKEFKILGSLYEKQKKEKQAIKSYKKYLDKKKENALAQKVGTYCFGEKDFKDAIKYLSMITGKAAAGFSVQMMLGESYFFEKKYDEAIAVFTKLKARQPKLDTKKNIFKYIAQSYEEKKDYASASAMYVAYTSIKGVRDADASYKAASLLEKSSASKAALIYEKNTKKFPKDVRNYLRLGHIYAKNDKTIAKSIARYKKVTTLSDKHPEVWLEIAAGYGKLKNEAKELEAYQICLKKYPQNVEANKRVGILLMGKGKTRQAMISLEMAKTLAPKDPEILLNLAIGYQKTNRIDQAINLLTKLKAVDKKNTEVRMNLVKLFNDKGMIKEAAQEIKELVAMDRDNKYLILYAEMLVKQKKYRDAEEVIADVRTSDPTNIDMIMLLAKIQVMRKKYKEALDSYQEIMDIDRQYAPAYYEKAEVLTITKRYPTAELFYKRCIKRDPKYARAYLGLAKIARIKKNKMNYLTNVKEAYKLDKNDPEIKAEYEKAKKLGLK